MPQTMPRLILYVDYDTICTVEDGIVSIRERTRKDRIPAGIPYTWAGPVRELAIRYGFRFLTDDQALAILQACDGNTLRDLVDEIKLRGRKAVKRRRKSADEKSRNDALRAKFGDMVIGMDDIDIYASGFTLSVLLNSRPGFDGQKEFLRGKTREIAKYAVSEIPYVKRAGAKSRRMAETLLPFCKLSETVLTRTNLLLLRFDIKPELAAALDGPAKAE